MYSCMGLLRPASLAVSAGKRPAPPAERVATQRSHCGAWRSLDEIRHRPGELRACDREAGGHDDDVGARALLRVRHLPRQDTVELPLAHAGPRQHASGWTIFSSDFRLSSRPAVATALESAARSMLPSGACTPGNASSIGPVAAPPAA